MYSLSPADLEIQARAISFADELIPYEEFAEFHDGELPDGVDATMRARVHELGLHSTNMPVDLGGQGCTMLQQVLVQEQTGRVTNALAWIMATPPAWLPEVATDEQIERYIKPAIRGEKEEAYAITEEFAGSDVDAITSTARREGDEYVLNGVKWHVTSFNSASFVFFQGKLTEGAHAGEHAMFIIDLPHPGVVVDRTPAYTHTINHHHPIVSFNDVRVPAGAMVGNEGDGMGFAYEKLKRKVGDYATAAAAVVLTVSGGKCTSASIGLTNVAETPLLAEDAAAALVGSTLDKAAIDKAVAAAEAITNPAHDARGTPQYRTKMAGVMLRRAIARAMTRAHG